MSTPTSAAATAVHHPILLPSLTSLRFLGATVIFLFHATNFVVFASPGVGETFLSLVTMGGFGGMTFFFVLSGFVLTWVTRPDDRARTFWRRRLVRVFPNHLVMFAATAILSVTVLDQVFNGEAALLNVLLLQAWSPDLDTRIAFNSPSWSLSAEMLFYLCFPVLLWIVRQIRPERLWAVMIGVLAMITVVVPVVVTRLPHDEIMPFLDLSMEQFWILFHFPPVRMLEFFAGMVLARIVMTGRRVPVSFGGAAALTIGAYAIGWMLPPTFRLVAVMTIPLCLLIAAGAVADLNRTRKSLLTRPALVYLGNVSYAFYLVHLQVLVFGSYWIGTTEPGSTPYGIAMLVVLYGIAVAISWLLFNLVEQPLMRRFGAQPRARRIAAVESGVATAGTPADRGGAGTRPVASDD